MGRLEGFDHCIQNWMTSWHCPGAAVAIVKDDDVLFLNSYGLRDVEDHLPMTEDTRFAMASVTKSFTAMSVALLVDEGKLEWDKPVREYIPEFILDDPYISYHVTVRDMLSHRTGLPRHDLSAWRMDMSRAEFVKRMKYFKFSSSFREKFQYNNLMYYVSAYLVEKITGQKFEDFVQRRIFSPLDMVASNFVPEPPSKGQINAKGYRVDRDETGAAKGLVHIPFRRHTDLAPGAAGALFSTLADLIRWLKVHVNEGQASGVRLISRDNLKQMHLPQMVVPGGGVSETLLGNTIFTYGMGWFVEPYMGYTIVHHGGNVEGHSLIIGFVPQEKIGVIALTNIAGLPLRDVLLYEGIDRALDLPDRDWNTRYHEIFDPIIVAEAKGKQTTAEERLIDAPPTHPWEAYAGTYVAKGYPDFAVRQKNDGLQACTVGILDCSDLRHYHYNVFEWHLADFDFWMKIRFLVNDNGEIDSISIPIEPAVDDVIFVRKQPELTEDIIDALIGEYNSPIDGIAFAITAHAGKVYVAQTGSPPEEIKPYKVNDAVVGFRLKRIRLDFVNQNKEFTHIVIKTPDMTIEASRK
jgi:CubicO group peptidase (beta-lactamase class C family)